MASELHLHAGKQSLAPKSSILGSLPRWETWAIVLGVGAVGAGAVLLYKRLSARPHAEGQSARFSTAQRQSLGEAYAHFLAKYPAGMTLKDLEAVYAYDHSLAQLVFRAIDKDRSGLIDVREWFLHRVALQNPIAAIRFAFEVFDEDGSGGLDFAEVTKMFTIYQRSHIVDDSKQADVLARELFAECKKPVTASLNLSEFTVSMRKLYESVNAFDDRQWTSLDF